MHHFDEKQLVAQLEQLPVAQRVAFAAAAAARQVANVGRAPEHAASMGELFREALDAVWQAATSPDSRSSADWNGLKAALTEHMTDDSRDNFPVWTVWHALCDDALGSLVYAIRTIETGKAQEAAWSGRRAYAAADQAAIRLLEVQTGLPETEQALLAHPVVQRELQRQVEDLASISDIQGLRSRALQSALLTQEEIAALDRKSAT